MTSEFLSSHWNFTGVDDLYYSLKNVYVDTKSGIVFDENLEPIFKLCYEALFWGPAIPAKYFTNQPLLTEALCKKYINIEEKRKKLVSFVENTPEISLLDEAVYLLHPFGWYAYGHLHDSLMRLFSIPKKLNEAKLLCCDYRRVVEFDRHIEALGFEARNVLDRRELPDFVKVNSLHYGVNPGVPTNYTHESYGWMRQCYLEHFLPNESLTPIKGLYLSRNSVKEGARGVLNEVQVTEKLSDEGFVIVDGTQSLEEIVSLFSRANIIIGPHGSLFVNTIFASENAIIHEFCPRNRADFSFKNKYKACTNYHHHLVEADAKHNITIDIEVLDKIVNEY